MRDLNIIIIKSIWYKTLINSCISCYLLIMDTDEPIWLTYHQLLCNFFLEPSMEIFEIEEEINWFFQIEQFL